MFSDSDLRQCWGCCTRIVLAVLVATEQQLEEAKQYIERNVMSHIYVHAMYPNGDADVHRDL